MKRWLALALATALGLAILFAIDGNYRNQVRQRNSQQLVAALEIAKHSLEEGVDLRTLVVKDLRAFILASPTMPDSETFNHYAALVLDYSPTVRSLQYVDTDHIIRYNYPLEGNEAALNLNLMTRPAAPFVKKAIRTRATTINDPTVTVQGSLSIVARSPIYDGDRYLGLAQGVFDISTLLEEVSEELTPQFDVLLKDANGNIFWESETFSGKGLSSPVRVGDNKWELTLGWILPEPGPEPDVLALIWGLGGALLVSVLFIINQTFRRVDWLSAAVEEKSANLIKSEARYRAIVDDQTELICRFSLDYHLTFVNEAYRRYFGGQQAELLECNMMQFVPAENQAELKAHLASLNQANPVTAREEKNILPGGKMRWLQWTNRAIFDDQGQVIEFQSVGRDITDRKQAEKKIQFQAHLLDMVEQAVIATDLEETIVYWNKFAEKLYGWSSAEIIGRNILEITPAETTQQQAAEIMAAIKSGQSWSEEFHMKRKDGTSFPAAVSNSPIYNDKGTLIGIVGVSSDITERKHLEEEQATLELQFRQAQKMEAVGQLTAGIAHDFNNMIMSINGNAELMQMQLHPEDPFYVKTDAILQAGLRAANLIRQLLIFSRKQIMTPRIVELNAIITEMNQILERIIGEHIQVKLILAPDLWPVKVDAAQIEQVIANLVINARDAMPDGGRLSLETANMDLDETYTASQFEIQPGEYVLLTVSDTGVGMSQEVQSHLFEPFFTTKKIGKGTGLGLATVYGIVKQSGGHILVHSKEGQGSTFKIYLPRTTEVATPATPASPTQEIKGGQETILVVEDEAAVRNIARDVLSMQGYTMLEAADSEQALQVAADHTGPIHLLLTDVIMPGMNGKALAEELTRKYPHLKVIFMSGYADEFISHHSVLEPGVVLLQKPFSFMEMARKVREMLG